MEADLKIEHKMRYSASYIYKKYYITHICIFFSYFVDVCSMGMHVLYSILSTVLEMLYIMLSDVLLGK